MSTQTLDHVILDPTAQDVLFRDARTANAFLDEPVSDEQVQALYDLVKWAPTSMNSQPLRMLLVRSDDARARLLGHMSPGNRAKTESAPLIAVLAADTEFHEKLPRLFPHAPQAKSMFADPVARERAARNGAMLQAGYFILGVRALGLAAGPMGGYDAAGLDADLLTGTTWKSIMVVNIGKPAENAWFDRLPRLEYDEVVASV